LSNANHYERSDKRAPSRTDERQRNARDREEPDIHPHIQKHLEDEKYREAKNAVHPKRISAPSGDAGETEEKPCVQAKQHRRTDEPKLFRDDGKNEICFLFWEKIQLAL
jgi:hypothetical protein